MLQGVFYKILFCFFSFKSTVEEKILQCPNQIANFVPTTGDHYFFIFFTTSTPPKSKKKCSASFNQSIICTSRLRIEPSIPTFQGKLHLVYKHGQLFNRDFKTSCHASKLLLSPQHTGKSCLGGSCTSFANTEICQPNPCMRRKERNKRRGNKKGWQKQLQPDPPFHNFRASKNVGRRPLC